MGVTLSDDTTQRINELAQSYEDSRSAVLPALYAVQEQIGYVPEEAVGEVADILALPRAEVGAVASFYTMYYKKPVGKHVISVCVTLSCALLGAEHLLDYLSRKLNVKVGETTGDGLFSLHAVECLGNCDHAPAVMIDDTYHDCLTEARLDDVLRDLGWREPSDAEAPTGRPSE